MERVTVEVSDRWIRLVRSPWYWIIAALTGVSITFAPLFLFWAGQAGHNFLSPHVLALFAVIYLIPLIYVKLGSLIMVELRRPSA